MISRFAAEATALDSSSNIIGVEGAIDRPGVPSASEVVYSARPAEHWRVRRRYKRCIGVGVALAAVFSVWVLAMYAVTDGRNIERLGVPLGAVLSGYWIGLPAVGAAVAYLHPLRRTRTGRAILGIVLGVPVGMVIVVRYLDRTHLGDWLWGVAVFAALGVFYSVLFIGPPAADDP